MKTNLSCFQVIHEDNLKLFIKESFAIENIFSFNEDLVYYAHKEFLDNDLTINSILNLCKMVEPRARLRDKIGLDVRIGSYVPALGHPDIYERLKVLLEEINNNVANVNESSVWLDHVKYETLHPFTDGNGRTGRAIWLWQWCNQLGWPLPPSFLHMAYYQAINLCRDNLLKN